MTVGGTTAMHEAQGRAWLYGLLGRLFDDVPDDELMVRLTNGDRARLAAVAAAVGVSQESASKIAALTTDDTTPMAVEFTSLFEAHSRIYPFASCWTGEKPRLMRKPWAMVNSEYARFGFGLSEDRLPRADHIGTELSFLSVLASREAGQSCASEQSVARAEFERFLMDHMLPWVPAFCAKVISDARADVYAAFAETLAAVLASEIPGTTAVPNFMFEDSPQEVEL